MAENKKGTSTMYAIYQPHCIQGREEYETLEEAVKQAQSYAAQRQVWFVEDMTIEDIEVICFEGEAYYK